MNKFTLGVGMLLLLGCSKSTPEPSLVTAPDASDAPDASGDCSIIMGAAQCGPSPLCCKPLVGFRVHIRQECVETVATPLVCRGMHAAGGACLVDDGEGCFVRSGSEPAEIFRTPNSGTDSFAGFEPCSGDVQATVQSLKTRADCGAAE